MKRNGFTLIELMIAIALLGILLALGEPAFTVSMNRARTDAAAGSLSVALATARSEAVNRGENVSICKSVNGSSCVTTGNWSSDWVIYVTAGTPINVFDAHSGSLTMTGASNVANLVTFTPIGGTNPGGGDITVCKTGQVAKVVSVSDSWRIRVSAGVCVDEDQAQASRCDAD